MLLYERQTLKEGRKLLLGSTEYNIVKVIGKGGSCIVYEAVYADNIGKKHTVRIKECFPHGLRIARNITGALSVDENDRNEFKNRKVRFIQAYENNVNFRELCGITNSVPEASNIYRQNNTVYTVVSTSEGKVYGSYKSKNLKEIFTIAKTLTGLIGRYHEQNLLYLDIKPDNIYILPETKQQIILFDFDSVMQTPITEDEAADMSCSSGFAAPELMMGKLNKIGKHTDIYAIGAVVFYKIFGRAPSAHDKMSACVYDFSSIQFADENYNPRLYTRLETFFRKTITASPVNRFQSTEEMQGILEELENLSDLDSMYLHSTMPPAPKFSFVGRREETEELAEAVRSHGKVFVTGMGGIGKTEIVKKYLQEKKDDYNTVVFALYEESLKETVCGECFDVNNLIRGENESDDEFYSRKYHFLKELDENDIIVIDNFDVFDDEKLDDFLNLRCKVIFTSRNSCFRDYGYCEVEIEEIGSLRELCEIFEIYNEGAYSPMDVKAIEDLILFVESHTMTVELLAKYIRVSGEAPIKVLKKMQESAKGVTNISQARVLMEKDRRRSSNSVNRYLLTLFDIFKFSAREKELLTTLSVFGSVRIKKELFLNIYRDEYAADTVRALAYAGWIEEDESSGKISLHQIILDLIYNELGHDTSVCRVGVNGMIEYMRMSNYDAVLSVNRKRLAKAFCKRLQGDDLLKALFNIAYCGFVQYDERLTAETEEISNNCDSMDAAVIHARNICIQTAHLYECYCFTDFEKTEEYIRDLYEKLLRLEAAFFRKFANFAGGEDKFEEIASDDIVNCFCELADVIDKLTGKICTECMEIYPPQFNEIESLYRNAEGLLKYAAYLAENAKKGNISKKIKVRIYRKQIEFYSDDDYMNFVRCGVLASPVKSVEVSEKLAGLLKSAETADKTAGSGKNSDGDCSQVDLDSGAGVDLDLDAGSDPTLSADFGSVADSNLDLDLGLDLGLSLDLDLVKYSDAADSALYDGALAEAEILYKKSQESSDEFTDYAKEKLSEVYSRQKRYDDAERILSEILADDIKNGYDTMWTLEKIMLLNEQKKNHEKALKYCTEIIELLSKNPNALTQNEQTTLLICLAKRTKYEKKTVLDEGDARIFEKRLHDLYGADFADEALKEALEVYCEYLKSCGRISDACEMLLRFAKKYQLQVSLDTAHELYRSIIENEKYFIAAPELYALALIFDADTLSELDREMNYEYALRLCMKAKKIISSEWENAEAVNAIYHRVIADVYMAESYAKSEAEMQECDYLLLTEQRLLKREFEGNEFYLWKDCLEKYKQTDKHSMQKVCLDHMKECIQKSKDKSGGRNICLDYYSALLEYDDEIGDTAEMSKHIDELYMEICRKECSLKADYKLCKLIEKAARLLDDMQRGNEAIFLLVMLGNIMLSEKITEEYCNVNSMSEVNREITEKVALTFVKSFNDAQKDRKNIGSLTEIMKMTAKISEKSGEKKIADMLINAVEGYTLSEIEFKHGRYE